jgi:uncharacterized protein
MKYTELEQLNNLREKGAITEEEYQREKQKILDSDYKVTSLKSDTFGMDLNTYCMFIHLSQFCGFIFPLAGMIVPIVLWVLNKDNSPVIDRHGKNVVNWIITSILIYAVLTILCFVLIGVPLIIAFGIAHFVFIIIGALKAKDGIVYKYPFALELIK